MSKKERIIIESTGCKNLNFVREALRDHEGDVDMTCEYMIAMRESGAYAL